MGRAGTLALYAPDDERGGSTYWLGWYRLISTLGRGVCRGGGASGKDDSRVPSSAVSLGSIMGALMWIMGFLWDPSSSVWSFWPRWDWLLLRPRRREKEGLPLEMLVRGWLALFGLGLLLLPPVRLLLRVSFLNGVLLESSINGLVLLMLSLTLLLSMLFS